MSTSTQMNLNTLLRLAGLSESAASPQLDRMMKEGLVAVMAEGREHLEYQAALEVANLWGLRGDFGESPVFRPQEGRPDRQHALSAVLAEAASRLVTVRQFRREVMQGELIEHRELPNWVATRSQPVPAEDDATTVYVRFATVDGAITLTASKHRDVVRAQRIVAELSGSFGWDSAQSFTFLLTGLIPLVEEFRVRAAPNSSFPGLTRLQLEVDPILSPREVMDRYRDARDRFFEGNYRPMSDKHIALVLFTPRGGVEDETWEDRMNSWNERQPADWRYDDADRFGHDTRVAWRRLLDPGYNVVKTPKP